jgi:DNA recombination protein RmuC
VNKLATHFGQAERDINDIQTSTRKITARGDKIAEIEVMDATNVSGPASDSVSDSGSDPAAGLAAGSAKSQQDLLG